MNLDFETVVKPIEELMCSGLFHMTKDGRAIYAFSLKNTNWNKLF